MRFKGKTVIVTGGSQGTGRSICLEFAKEGADCVVVGHSSLERTKQVADEVRELGSSALALTADVSKIEDVKAMVEKTINQFGKIDILVNNAAPSKRGETPVIELSEAEWNKYIGVILTGTFLCSKVVGMEMIKKKEGKIINMASVLASAAIPGRAAYGASKAGVLQFTKLCALEWGKYNINVNALSFGMTMSGQFEATAKNNPGIMEAMLKRYPIKRFNRPEDVANAVLFLASPEAENITGQEIIVDSGANALLSCWEADI